MNRFERDALESLEAYEERQRRHAKRHPPMRRSLPASTWAPKLTEQQQQEQEQYIKDNALPF